MKRRTRLLSTLALAAITATALAACGSSSNPVSSEGGNDSGSSAGSVVIGSTNFPENELLANIYADVLRAKGVKVSTQLNIGSREIVYKLIQSGKITVLPEYNGALLAYLDPKTTATTKDATDQELSAKLDPKLEVLEPSSAEDKDSLNVTKANAEKYDLHSIADLTKVADTFTLGGPPEFKTRLQGVVGLKSVYGVDFSDRFQPLDEAGKLTIDALKDGSVQVADIFSTDPSIVANNFVTLTDPKGLFGAQNVVPLVYKAGVNQTIVDALNAVSAKLDTPTLARLVSEVVSDKKDSTAVASEFAKSAGLV